MCTLRNISLHVNNYKFMILSFNTHSVYPNTECELSSPPPLSELVHNTVMCLILIMYSLIINIYYSSHNAQVMSYSLT